MLKVTLEIIPHGDESKARVIDTIHIANVHTDEDNVADYEVWDSHSNEAEVIGHKRGRKNGQWRLVRKAIMAILNVKEK